MHLFWNFKNRYTRPLKQLNEGASKTKVGKVYVTLRVPQINNSFCENYFLVS